jgi:hypothetical protein
VLCRAEEAAELGSALQAGGVIVIVNDDGESRQLQIHQLLGSVGFDGCGWQDRFHWGVRQPHLLSSDAVLDRALGALQPPAGEGRGLDNAIVTS